MSNVCFQWQQYGRCSHGSACRYLHAGAGAFWQADDPGHERVQPQYGRGPPQPGYGANTPSAALPANWHQLTWQQQQLYATSPRPPPQPRWPGPRFGPPSSQGTFPKKSPTWRTDRAGHEHGTHSQSSPAAEAAEPKPAVQLARARESPESRKSQLVEEPTYHDRVWKYIEVAEAAGAVPVHKFRVVSYNILGDQLAAKHKELYRNTPKRHMAYARRWRLICEEIRHLQPDVLCLQEIEHFDDVQRTLHGYGYDGSIVPRTGDRTDGCGTFWLRSVFHAVSLHPMQFAKLDLRDNVAAIVVLERRAERPHARYDNAPTLDCTRCEDGLQQSLAAVPLLPWRFRSDREDAAAKLDAAAAVAPDDAMDGSWSADTGSSSDLAPDPLPPGTASPDSPRTPPKRHRTSHEHIPTHAAEAADSRSPLLVVCNTHVLFNPKRGDIKLGQLRALTAAAAQVAKAARTERRARAGGAHGASPVDDAACLVIGDMNAAPHSALYRFMTHGWMDLFSVDRREASGVIEDRGGQRVLPSPDAVAASAQVPDPATIYDPFGHLTLRERYYKNGRRVHKGWALEDVLLALGANTAQAAATTHAAGAPPGWFLRSATARHPLRLRSAYADACGREPEFTSFHNAFCGTLDYVWYTPHLTAEAAPAAAAGTRAGLVPGPPSEQGPRLGAEAGGSDHGGLEVGEVQAASGGSSVQWRLRVTGALLPPDLAWLRRSLKSKSRRGMPSRRWPSDHVSLAVEFALTTE